MQSTGNQFTNNGSYNQTTSVIERIENDEQWDNESNINDENEYTEQNNQSESLNSVAMLINNGKRGRKKANSQTTTELLNLQKESVVSFALNAGELTKLTAISTLLGYQDISLFAKDLVNKGVEPYFELASRTLKSQHFNHNNE